MIETEAAEDNNLPLHPTYADFADSIYMKTNSLDGVTSNSSVHSSVQNDDWEINSCPIFFGSC